MQAAARAIFSGRAGRVTAWMASTLAVIALLVIANWGGDLTIRMEVENGLSEGQVVVYYDDGTGYREQATVRAPAKKGAHRYEFRLPVSRVNGFRIDPSMNDSSTRIAAVDVLSRGTVIRRFQGRELVPVNQIASSQVLEKGRGIRFVVQRDAKDPYFVVSNSALVAGGGGGAPLGAIVFSVAFVALAIGGLNAVIRKEEGDRGFFLAGFGIAAGLASAMAVLTTMTGVESPDEISHILAGRYYLDRWLPPAVGDPASLASFSVYGFSYLTEPDIVYLVAAKLVAATSFISLEDFVRFRFFNVFLLVLCLYQAMRSRVALLVALPILCTPQAWYLFSYFNADAFALVVAILLSVAVASQFHSAHPGPARSGETVPADLKAALTIGVLLALAILSKKTFYPIVVLVCCYALWQAGFRQVRQLAPGLVGLFLLAIWAYSGKPYENSRALIESSLGRLGLLSCAGALMAASAWQAAKAREVIRRIPASLWIAVGAAGVLLAFRAIIEVYAVGWPWDKAAALAALAERIAGPAFRPSTIATDAGYASAALASKGVDLPALLIDRFWVFLTSASFFGVYRYMEIYGPSWLYSAQYAVALLLMATLLARCGRDRDGRGIAVLGTCVIAMALLLSILHSWVRDFQPQGRYVFVILPVAGMLMLESCRADLARGSRSLEWRLAMPAVAVLWLFSFISFAFVGLPAVARP